MKKSILIVCLLVVFALQGCGNELSPEEIKEFATQIEAMSDKLDGYQDAADSLTGFLGDYGVLEDEVIAKAEKINAQIDKVQAQITAITEKLGIVDYSDNGFEALLEAIQEANRASMAFNPYSPQIEIGVSAAILLLGLFAKKKAKEAADNAALAEKNELKYKAHKAGAELTMRANPEIASELYRHIADARADLGVR